MEEFEHLKLQLKDIISATENFVSKKLIGCGGFGSVYRGELFRPHGFITVACKRLDSKFGQGNVEFLKEIMMLSKYKHENLVSLLHFCNEGDEKILVYEYVSRGSLDRYIGDPCLTWTQRLKICVGVAHALNYLHHPTGTHQRILHRDIKSSNILLDDDWNAKVSDFGLSKIGPANQPQTYLVSDAVGTLGYCDPLYWETGILSKESDVYSLGVVLFEVMCGTLCCEYRDGRLVAILVPMWKKSVVEKKIYDITFHSLKEHLEPGSLKTFSAVAYRCLEKTRKERPTMAEIVQELQIALEQQEVFEHIGKRLNFEGMRKIADFAVSPLSYVTHSQLLLLFMKGVLVDNGKTWFSVNKEGQHCELISSSKCASASDNMFIVPDTNLCSRFQHQLKYVSTQDLRLTVKTQFLSANVTYLINLVYECDHPYKYELRIPFKYKLEETGQYSTSCVAHVGEDGWLRTELFQFTSSKEEYFFEIQFLSEMNSQEHRSISISIEGIEFCPIDIEQDKKKVLMQQGIDRRESYDYTEIVEWLKDINHSMTLKEVSYSLLRRGVYINNPKQWFSISKKSKKRFMLPARAILGDEKSGWNFLSREKSWQWKSLPGSRFGEAAESCNANHLTFSLEIGSQLFSPGLMYAFYLVFKLPEHASGIEGIVITGFKERVRSHKPTEHLIYLRTPPHTPIIILSPDERPSQTHKIKGHPKLRKDGWMEIQVWEFLPGPSSGSSSFWMDGYLKSSNEWNFTGLVVQGIEIRPAKVSWSYFKPVLFM